MYGIGILTFLLILKNDVPRSTFPSLVPNVPGTWLLRAGHPVFYVFVRSFSGVTEDFTSAGH
jgi:hypothetical protein